MVTHYVLVVSYGLLRVNFFFLALSPVALRIAFINVGQPVSRKNSETHAWFTFT